MAKRVLDLLLGTIVLIVCTPALLLAIALIRIVDGSPVLFRQVRPGYKGRPFTLYFRTMKVLRREAGVRATDAARLTSVGRVLRQLSIDKLPQL